MITKSKFYLTVVFTLAFFMLMTSTQAQIYTPSSTIQGSSGSSTNVGIGVSSPASRLAILGTGNSNYSLYSYRPASSTATTIAVYGNSAGTTSNSRHAYGMLGSIVSGTGYTYGVMGRATRSTSSSSGRAYGLYGRANNSSINYGVFGIIDGSNRGAAIFGSTQTTSSSSAIFNNRWAGYFVGQVKMTASLMIGGGKSDMAPAGYLLAVDGKVIAEEVKVEMSDFWDEVFEEDYDLMSIEEKEAFTKTNKHLPSFAPEKEIVENGIEVGASYANMAKELEEAYQYIFELNKLMKEMNSSIDEIKKENDLLRAKLENMSND